MSEEQDILTQLGVKDISQQNANKFYKFAVYGKFGTGKTTFLTKDNNALVLDINEDGTTVTEDGAVVQVKNYKHFVAVVKALPQILEQLRSNGKQIDVVVIETIQKLRDITIDDIMSGQTKKPTFNDWGATATRIVHMYRFISKLQEHYQFHLAISGHEGINKDKDDEGSTINPTITIEAQEQIKKAVLSQSDVLGRMMIEENEEDGQKAFNYVFNAEPSPIFETKIRHSPSVMITNKKFINPSINDVVEAIRNGN
ncbi:chromosomal replication initiator DnaA [Staphylococcus felis]|uniref:ATP-binding protein n=1 Tax=Staphylococcus felis TaxID=46127 RepID=UPI000E2804BE|nr:ATP-binding protein [Staphylococcus felis]REH95134.1 chromosomal replication initiator DnaA [Staphylococcus felis]REI04038.1 chromosomal replication initiator DnaA [Staphylococcus felis]REI11775.1 chromosomal replication initiator DnaA [Staphylococcus felis]REI19607.1 chromosomal replication initiator DnaA [Staphylococcus felis]REI32750.1 chromosomal replication initiator DnaA [Staphylococcus felis]